MLKYKILQRHFIIFLMYAVPCMPVAMLLSYSFSDMELGVIPLVIFAVLWLLQVIFCLGYAIAGWIKRDSDSKYYLLAALMILLLGPVSCGGLLHAMLL